MKLPHERCVVPYPSLYPTAAMLSRVLVSVYPQEGRPGVLQDNGLAEPHPLTSLMLGPPPLH